MHSIVLLNKAHEQEGKITVGQLLTILQKSPDKQNTRIAINAIDGKKNESANYVYKCLACTGLHVTKCHDYEGFDTDICYINKTYTRGAIINAAELAHTIETEPILHDAPVLLALKDGDYEYLTKITYAAKTKTIVLLSGYEFNYSNN